MGKLANVEDAASRELARGCPSLAATLNEENSMIDGDSQDSAAPACTAVGASRHGLGTWFHERLYRAFIEPLVSSRNPPWFDARGVAMGLVIGLLVPVGGHTVTLTVLRLLVRFNYLVSLAFSLISNPVTMIPLYYGYYLLGCVILGSSASINFEIFQELMNQVLDRAYFWEATTAFMRLGREILIRWFVSAVVLSVVVGTVGYVVTLRVQTARLKAAAERLGETYGRILAQLDQHARADERS